jgi:hypothetical protein
LNASLLFNIAWATPRPTLRLSALSTLANARNMSELEGIGVQLHDPVEKFWSVFGERMKVHLPEAAVCAPAISKEICEYGIISVGGMATLSMHEMEQCIVDGGGSKKWAKAVGRLLGMKSQAKPSNRWGTDAIIVSR